MALARINAKLGGAAFLIGTQEYNTVLDSFRLREVTGMDPSAVFTQEGVADQEPMSSQLVGELSGINTKGAVESGPLIPAPQNVAVKATYTTGCFFMMTADFPEAWADRLVNNTSRIGARFLSKGAYTKTWVNT